MDFFSNLWNGGENAPVLKSSVSNRLHTLEMYLQKKENEKDRIQNRLSKINADISKNENLKRSLEQDERKKITHLNKNVAKLLSNITFNNIPNLSLEDMLTTVHQNIEEFKVRCAEIECHELIHKKDKVEAELKSLAKESKPFLDQLDEVQEEIDRIEEEIKILSEFDSRYRDTCISINEHTESSSATATAKSFATSLYSAVVQPTSPPPTYRFDTPSPLSYYSQVSSNPSVPSVPLNPSVPSVPPVAHTTLPRDPYLKR